MLTGFAVLLLSIAVFFCWLRFSCLLILRTHGTQHRALRIANANSLGFPAAQDLLISGATASIGLHRACGFEIVGVEREVGRKFGRWLDVVELQRLL